MSSGEGEIPSRVTRPVGLRGSYPMRTALTRRLTLLALPFGLAIVALALLIGLPGQPARASSAPQASQADLGPRAVVRTGVIHEISDFTVTATLGGNKSPVLSRDGTKLAFGRFVGE